MSKCQVDCFKKYCFPVYLEADKKLKNCIHAGGCNENFIIFARL
jgi:hypothetical protein